MRGNIPKITEASRNNNSVDLIRIELDIRYGSYSNLGRQSNTRARFVAVNWQLTKFGISFIKCGSTILRGTLPSMAFLWCKSKRVIYERVDFPIGEMSEGGVETLYKLLTFGTRGPRCIMCLNFPSRARNARARAGKRMRQERRCSISKLGRSSDFRSQIIYALVLTSILIV